MSIHPVFQGNCYSRNILHMTLR